jgi:signal transduction histidine kinase
MSIKLRLALLLGLLLLAFLASLLALRHFELRQAEQMLANLRESRTALLDRWVDLTGDSLRQFANDHARGDEMAVYVAHPDPKWAEVNVDASLPNFNVQAAWVLRPDGSVVHAANRLQEPSLAQPPVPPPELRKLAVDTPFMHFFVLGPRGLLEVRGAPIQPSTDAARVTAPRGWFLVARLWDDAQLRTLAHLTECRATLIDANGQRAPAPAEGRNVHWIRPLNDWRGRPVRLLQFDYQAPEIAEVIQTNIFEIRVFAAFGLLVIGALALGLERWVLRPLGWISTSLARGDTAPLRPLLKEKGRTELGRVALLIESAFAQRTQLLREIEERKHAEQALRHSEAVLRRSLEERTRLGLDLHDGVIQALYAAGMGLVGIRAQLRADPAAAESNIEQIRALLNETIRDVRNFIIGLEPEALKEQAFARAIERLVDLMQSIHPVRAKIAIDEPLAARLTLEQRAHALQIAREAVSNALRHGQAGHVHLSLQRRAGRVEFTIDDDGCGFDPAASAGRGRGLSNLIERARELGAELTVSSTPGKGTRVTLIFPLPPSS